MSTTTATVPGFHEHTVDGTTYQVKSIIDRQMQADFERWLYRREAVLVAEGKELYSPEEFAEKRKKLEQDYRDGAFKFKSKAGAATLATNAGVQWIACQLLEGVDENEALAVIAADPNGFKTLLQQILEDSFGKMLKVAKKKGDK